MSHFWFFVLFLFTCCYAANFGASNGCIGDTTIKNDIISCSTILSGAQFDISHLQSDVCSILTYDFVELDTLEPLEFLEFTNGTRVPLTSRKNTLLVFVAQCLDNKKKNHFLVSLIIYHPLFSDPVIVEDISVSIYVWRIMIYQSFQQRPMISFIHLNGNITHYEMHMVKSSADSQGKTGRILFKTVSPVSFNIRNQYDEERTQDQLFQLESNNRKCFAKELQLSPKQATFDWRIKAEISKWINNNGTATFVSILNSSKLMSILTMSNDHVTENIVELKKIGFKKTIVDAVELRVAARHILLIFGNDGYGIVTVRTLKLDGPFCQVDSGVRSVSALNRDSPKLIISQNNGELLIVDLTISQYQCLPIKKIPRNDEMPSHILNLSHIFLMIYENPKLCSGSIVQMYNSSKLEEQDSTVTSLYLASKCTKQKVNTSKGIIALNGSNYVAILLQDGKLEVFYTLSSMAKFEKRKKFSKKGFPFMLVIICVVVAYQVYKLKRRRNEMSDTSYGRLDYLHAYNPPPAGPYYLEREKQLLLEKHGLDRFNSLGVGSREEYNVSQNAVLDSDTSQHSG